MGEFVLGVGVLRFRRLKMRFNLIAFPPVAPVLEGVDQLVQSTAKAAMIASRNGYPSIPQSALIISRRRLAVRSNSNAPLPVV